MVEIDKKQEGNISLGSLRVSYSFIETIDKLLSKRFKDVKIKLDFFNHNFFYVGDQIHSYFNGKAYITVYDKNVGRVLISNFSLSCFPNCCGIGILTCNYNTYARPTNYEGFESGTFTIKLAKAIAEIHGYPTLMLTLVEKWNNSKEIKPIIENEGWKQIANTARRTYETQDLLTYINTDLKDSQEQLIKFLTNAIKEKKEVTE